MSEKEFRQDDRVDYGWCPVCSVLMEGLTTDGHGVCEIHGRQAANYEGHVWEFSAWVTVFAPTEQAAKTKLDEVQGTIDLSRADVRLSIDDGQPTEVTEDWL